MCEHDVGLMGKFRLGCWLHTEGDNYVFDGKIGKIKIKFFTRAAFKL